MMKVLLRMPCLLHLDLHVSRACFMLHCNLGGKVGPCDTTHLIVALRHEPLMRLHCPVLLDELHMLLVCLLLWVDLVEHGLLVVCRMSWGLVLW
jgi:hypothetical protein